MSKVTPPKESRHAKRKAKTRQGLIQATTDLLFEKSFDALTVQDITERADVGRGTFYTYFASKEEVVWSLLETLLSDIDQYLQKHPMQDEESRLRKWHFIFTSIDQNRDILEVLLGEKGHISMLRRLQSYIVQLMTRDLKAGYLIAKDNLPIDFVSQYLAGALSQVIIHWLEQEEQTVEQIIEAFFQMANHHFIQQT